MTVPILLSASPEYLAHAESLADGIEIKLDWKHTESLSRGNTLASLTPVLLSVLAGGSSLDDLVTLAMDARHRLAGAGKTETLEASLTRWKKHLS